MQNRFKILKNKRGAGNIRTAVIFLSVLMLFSFVLTFYEGVRVTENIKEAMELSLSSLIRDESRTIMNSLKNSDSLFYENETDLSDVETLYIKYLKENSGITEENGSLVLRNGNGRKVAEIKEITMEKSESGLSLGVRIKISLSVIFMGEVYENVNIPIEIEKKMKLERKF